MAVCNGEKIKSLIAETLTSRPDGITIQDLASKIHIHRQTAAKYVEELKIAGIVFRRDVGSASLLYLKKEEFP